MKRLILALLALLLTPQMGLADIAHVTEAHLDVGSATSLAVTITVNVGDTVIVTHTNSHGSDTTTAPTDTGGNTYTKCGAVSPNTTVAMFYALNVSNSATSVTVNASTTDNISASIATYSGVGSIAQCTSNTASGTGTAGTISVTPAATTSWVVVGATNLGNASSCLITTGTFRATCYANNQGSTMVSVIDQTGASPMTNAWSWTTSGGWGVVSIELVAPAAASTNFYRRRFTQ